MIRNWPQAIAFAPLVASAVVGAMEVDRWMLATCSNGLLFAGAKP